MKKLTLELETLRVESFETAGTGPAPRGTVRANGETYPCTEPITCINVEPTGACQTMGTGCPGSAFTVCACSANGFCTTDTQEH